MKDVTAVIQVGDDEVRTREEALGPMDLGPLWDIVMGEYRSEKERAAKRRCPESSIQGMSYRFPFKQIRFEIL